MKSIGLILIATLMAFSTAQANDQAHIALELILDNLQLRSGNLETQAEILKNFSDKGRDFVQLKITSKNSQIRPALLLLSGPPGFQNGKKRLPVLFISAGFFTGMASISLVQNPGNLILAGYEYPTTIDKVQADPAQFLDAIRQVPGQIAASLLHLQKLPYIDGLNVNFMAVSLGTLFAPISLRVAERLGVLPTKTILTFGGADIGAVFSTYLQGKIPPGQIEIIRKLAEALTTLQDPRLHLPELIGNFLFIGATRDEVFTTASQIQFANLLPDPKEIYWLDSQHIGVGRPEIIEATMNIVKDFLQN